MNKSLPTDTEEQPTLSDTVMQLAQVALQDSSKLGDACGNVVLALEDASSLNCSGLLSFTPELRQNIHQMLLNFSDEERPSKWLTDQGIEPEPVINALRQKFQPPKF